MYIYTVQQKKGDLEFVTLEIKLRILLYGMVTTYQKRTKMNWKEYRGEQLALYLVGDTITQAAYPT
jgi:hypothetical protein